MKIGELAKATATKVETVRFYEKIGLLPPPARNLANYRDYGSEQLARLSFIRRARDLSDDKAQSCEAVDDIAQTHLFKIDRKIDDLAAMRNELERVVRSCRHGTIGNCKIIQTLAPRH